MLESLEKLQLALGWRLPDEYRRYHMEGQYWANFFSPEEAADELRDWDHPRTLPLGGDGLGNMYVLGADGDVTFWDQERPGVLEPLHANFAEFLKDGLREFHLQREPRKARPI